MIRLISHRFTSSFILTSALKLLLPTPSAYAEIEEVRIVEEDGARWALLMDSGERLGPLPLHGALEIWLGAEDDAPGPTERWTAIECGDEVCAGVR